MQDPNSFPSFQPERENSLAEELYPDIFADAFPPIAPGPLTYDELRATGKLPRRTNTARTEKRAIAPGPLTYNELKATGKLPRRTSTAGTEKQAVRTEKSTDRVRAMPDDPAPLSLVDALQATITRKQPKRESQFVITADKKRQRNTDSVYRVRSEPTLQLTPRLRLAIIFVVIILILLAVLLFPIALSMS
jgi:hypothetical protein